GGDPLVFSDKQLDWLLGELRAIPHVEVVRLGSRLPVVNPFRITEGLCDVLRKHHPVWRNTHFNHPKELTPEAAEACARLATAADRVPLSRDDALGRAGDHVVMATPRGPGWAEPNPIPEGYGLPFRLPEIPRPPEAKTIPTGAPTFVPVPEGYAEVG